MQSITERQATIKNRDAADLRILFEQKNVLRAFAANSFWVALRNRENHQTFCDFWLS